MGLQKKKGKDKKHIEKLIKKNPKDKWHLLTLNLK